MSTIRDLWAAAGELADAMRTLAASLLTWAGHENGAARPKAKARA